ncbi:MAG: sigma-70 family RNA polymerase sigma factor [Bacteroidales bacterium]|nr:sigma-70 family RNA polymerase sigma factor [Bacteroidales bacterium]
MKEYTDKEIIEGLRNRESEVVKYLFHRYMPVIRHLILKNGGTTDDAHDIFQEGLMVILEKVDEKSFTLTSKFITLLYCICDNLWKMVLVKRKAAGNYLKKAGPFEEIPDTDDRMDNELYESIFREAYESLDESCKKILKLSWQGMSLGEISDQLGLTYGYVKKKKSEAQAELTSRVKKHPEYIRIRESESRMKSVIH